MCRCGIFSVRSPSTTFNDPTFLNLAAYSARQPVPRIKAKRARYAAELARSSVGQPANRFIKSARAVQDLLGIHQDAIQAELHIRRFLKYSTSVRAGFVAGRMVERQRRQRVRKDMKSLFKALLKQGKKAWG